MKGARELVQAMAPAMGLNLMTSNVEIGGQPS